MQTKEQKSDKNCKIVIFFEFLANFETFFTYIEPFLRLNVPQKHLKRAFYRTGNQLMLQ